MREREKELERNSKGRDGVEERRKGDGEKGEGSRRLGTGWDKTGGFFARGRMQEGSMGSGSKGAPNNLPAHMGVKQHKYNPGFYR